MSFSEILWGFGPVVALLAFVIYAVAKNAMSKPHGLNKREGGTHFFGGPWTDYKFDEDGYHPDDEWTPTKKPRTSKKPRRKRKRRNR